MTCSIDEIPAAALMAIRCRTPSIPTDPIAMNTAWIPSNASVTWRGYPEPRAELSMEFEIRADIAKLTKTVLAEGSMWRGDVYFSELDPEGRALVVERHYGYRWLRVAWGVGSDLEGYPWPFRGPVQPLPQGPTEPPGPPTKLRPFGS
jgi:hypothetical protein